MLQNHKARHEWENGSYHSGFGDLPADRGAYVLVIELAAPTSIILPGQPEAVLAAGRYLYCGSAYGPGGIKARVSRHMRPDKAIRWHVDRLTSAGKVIGAWAFPGGNECRLVASLAVLPIPLPGFGSSDCRNCASHLLRWPDEIQLPPIP